VKTVYFVGHGESVNNVVHKFNALDTPLSEAGEKQALEIAERASKLKIDCVVASPLERAMKTAAVIAAKLKLVPEPSELFVEGVYASRILGASMEDGDVQDFIRTYYGNFEKPNFRLEDGENFEDLKTRALKGLEYLQQKPEENILVVSHGYFLKLIAAAAMFGERLTAHECLGVTAGLKTVKNTSVSVFRYGEFMRNDIADPTMCWKLIIWNDHAHLG
jgi:broad specificity phosphatase PhoE